MFVLKAHRKPVNPLRIVVRITQKDVEFPDASSVHWGKAPSPGSDALEMESTGSSALAAPSCTSWKCPPGLAPARSSSGARSKIHRSPTIFSVSASRSEERHG